MARRLSAKRVRELLDYDPSTGKFTWKQSRGGRAAGTEAGYVSTSKHAPHYRYRVIRIEGYLVVASHIAWAILMGQFPSEEIDHKDGNALNNRAENLRPSSHAQNCRNTRRRSNNTSGYKGVSFDNFTGRWVARVRVPDGKYESIGRFDDPSLAHDAYVVRSRELYGDFARAS